MTDARGWFDIITAALVFGLSIYGILRRCRRLVRLSQIVLVEPVHPADVEYLASVRRSTYLRLGVKVVLLIGSLIMLFQWPLFEIWRGGLVLMLVFMNMETATVDRIRERLARVGATA